MSPSHGLQLFTNCPSTGRFHECSPPGTDCSNVGPPRGHKSCQKICSSVGFSLHRSTGPARSLLQCKLPTGSQLPSGIHLLHHGFPSTGYSWISAPPWTSMDCRGTTCLTVVFIVNCKEKLSALVPGAPPPPPSSLTLVSAELFLSIHLTPLSQLPFHHSFFPLHKYVITEALPLPLLDLALASSGSVFELAALALSDMGEASCSF